MKSRAISSRDERPATCLPIHELWLRIIIDRTFTIVDAEVSSQWVPYGRLCAESNSAYRQLIGLNLFKSFCCETNQRLRGVAGCTHLTELCAVLPIAAVQAFAGEAWNVQNGSPFEHAEPDQSNATEEYSPFQFGRCHALRFDGPAVREHYPRCVDYRLRPEKIDGRKRKPHERSSNPKPESTK